MPRSSIGNADKKLREYLGAWGCQTRMLSPDSLIDTAKLAFDVPGRSITEVTDAVSLLGTRERSARVREAVRKHWPTPNVLWPANAPVRKLLKKELAP